MPPKIKNPSAYFWSQVARGNSSSCWPWLSRNNAYGYGVATWEGKQIQAHRVAYMLERGPIPKGLVLHHTCENRQCCNPAHLLLTTQSDHIRGNQFRVGKGKNQWQMQTS